MAGFFHFVELPLGEVVQQRTLQHDRLRDCGLLGVLDDCRDVPDDIVVTECVGPGGKPGVVLYPKTKTSPPRWTYSATDQEWVRIGQRWIGWERDAPPSPEDLERKTVYADYRVPDPAGRDWRVPCARSADAAGTSLPIEYVFSAAGTLLSKIPARLEQLWTVSGEVADHYSRRVVRDEAWQVEAALLVLQVNYRIGKGEVTALQGLGLPVLTRGTVNGILLALIDNDLQQEFEEQKKSEWPETSPAS